MPISLAAVRNHCRARFLSRRVIADAAVDSRFSSVRIEMLAGPASRCICSRAGRALALGENGSYNCKLSAALTFSSHLPNLGISTCRLCLHKEVRRFLNTQNPPDVCMRLLAVYFASFFFNIPISSKKTQPQTHPACLILFFL